ncbi:MAG: alpha/beta hydrolase [Candidatus Competibacterales bacterium]
MTTVYYGTNRRANRKNRPDDFEAGFSDDGLANLRFGEAEIVDDRIERLEVYHETPSGSVLGSQKLFDLLRERMAQEGCDVLLFIHGFNVTFHEALRNAAVMENLYQGRGGAGVALVAFSWPSDGNLAFYHSDRHDAMASGLALARGLAKAVGFIRQLQAETLCRQSIHLLAHSMGCYALRFALQAMVERGVLLEASNGAPLAVLAQRQPRPASPPLGVGLPRLLDQIILTAADEDNDALEDPEKLARLPELGNRVTVYCNPNDRPLTLSDWTKGNPDRLGSEGPIRPQNLSNKIDVVDCSPQVVGVVEHGYHYQTKAVVEDINTVLGGLASDQVAGREWVPSRHRFRLEHRA